MIDQHHPSPFDSGTESNVYTGVYKALVLGMTVSTVLFAIGTLLALLRRSNVSIDPSVGQPFHGVSSLFHALLHAEPTAFMALGTIVLILTPIARVAVSVVAFTIDHDYKFVGITAFVLVTIVITIVLGMLGILR